MKTAHHRPPLITFHVLFSVLCPLSSVFAQGSLTPPGAPAPTMKTLEQIASTGIAINATNTPGDATSLFVISAPGSYYLPGNITGVASKNGIKITADDVSVDLNGFALIGVASSLDGINVSGAHVNISVVNGTVRNWGSDGVDGANAFNSDFQRLRLSNNQSVGLRVGASSAATDCLARSNTATGIVTGTSARLVNCVASLNNSLGIDASTNCTLINCTATGDFGISGIHAGNGSTLTNCTGSSNSGANSHGIDAGIGCSLTNCAGRLNPGAGINASIGCTLTNCAATSNAGFAGIQTSSSCTLTNCSATNNTGTYGIQTGTGCTLLGCAARGNSSTGVTSAGITAAAGSTLIGCSVSANTNTNATPSADTGMGIRLEANSTVKDCVVDGNKGDGIRVAGDHCQVLNNTATGNGAGLAGSGGIHVTGSGCRIDGNHSSANENGFNIQGNDNFIVRNSTHGNTNFPYGFSGTQNYGTTVASPGANFLSTQPWANFGL